MKLLERSDPTNLQWDWLTHYRSRIRDANRSVRRDILRTTPPATFDLKILRWSYEVADKVTELELLRRQKQEVDHAPR
jgi:hypothetical protein